MSSGWENNEPAPLEYFHGKLMDAFHALRKKKVGKDASSFTLDGREMNGLIAKAKKQTYEKYPKQVSNNAIPKTEL